MFKAPSFSIRTATKNDIPALESLIALSARALSRGHYDDAQIEATIAHLFCIDRELIGDRTYYLAEAGDQLLGCGGWSARATLFGGRRYAERAARRVDPATNPAKIRAFFVHPEVARSGVASALLETSERAAAGAGFGTVDLMATLPSLPFYFAHGYAATGEEDIRLGGVRVPFIPMRKYLHWAVKAVRSEIDPVPAPVTARPSAIAGGRRVST